MVKWREESATLELEDEDEKQRQHVVVGLGDHGGAVKKQGKQQSLVVAHDRVHASSAYKACRVGVAVKAMDQDLYHIPPDMFCHEPRVSTSRPSHFHSSKTTFSCLLHKFIMDKLKHT